MHSPARIGIIGCGDAATRIYVPNSSRFEAFTIVACADIDRERADLLAHSAHIDAQSIAELLAREDLDVVLNLTSPAAHYETSLAAIEAGRHVYSEKPLAIVPADARHLFATAARSNVRIACSPDTFLGTALSTARQLVASGTLGVPISAEVVMQHSGPERFPHPRPYAFYAPGGGPLFDMGPYYLTPLIRLFGTVSEVEAMARTTYPTRTVLTGPNAGSSFDVTTPSHLAALLRFQAGLLASMTMSFDCAFWTHTFTLNGSDATLRLPDPDEFDGILLIRRSDGADWEKVEIVPGAAVNARGAGLADFVESIERGTPHLASANIALHVVDVMNAVLLAATERRIVDVTPLEPELGLLGGELPGVDSPASNGAVV
jgi:predicted dehydrogenase